MLTLRYCPRPDLYFLIVFHALASMPIVRIRVTRFRSKRDFAFRVPPFCDCSATNQRDLLNSRIKVTLKKGRKKHVHKNTFDLGFFRNRCQTLVDTRNELQDCCTDPRNEQQPQIRTNLKRAKLLAFFFEEICVTKL